MHLEGATCESKLKYLLNANSLKTYYLKTECWTGSNNFFIHPGSERIGQGLEGNDKKKNLLASLVTDPTYAISIPLENLPILQTPNSHCHIFEPKIAYTGSAK